MRRKIVVTLIAAFLVGAITHAAPVPETDRVPIDLRRTTLVVRDMDRSLSFYRDALGLEVIYDNVIRTPRDATSDEEATRSLRLVFLRANDDFVGIVGLMEYRKPRKTPIHQGAEPFSVGSTVFVFNAQDAKAVFENAKQINGVRVLSEPRETQYPSYDGTSKISVLVSVMTDPDGFVVELNQLLDEIKR